MPGWPSPQNYTRTFSSSRSSEVVHRSWKCFEGLGTPLIFILFPPPLEFHLWSGFSQVQFWGFGVLGFTLDLDQNRRNCSIVFGLRSLGSCRGICHHVFWGFWGPSKSWYLMCDFRGIFYRWEVRGTCVCELGGRLQECSFLRSLFASVGLKIAPDLIQISTPYTTSISEKALYSTHQANPQWISSPIFLHFSSTSLYFRSSSQTTPYQNSFIQAKGLYSYQSITNFTSWYPIF